MDVAIFCWVLTINRALTEEEYLSCVKIVQDTLPDTPVANRLRSNPPMSYELLREILAQILPLLMMRQQRIPRAHWQHFQTERGKRWIERDSANMHPSKHLTSMMGYTSCTDHNIVVMAAAQGKRHQVVNIGLDVRQCCIEPEGISVQQWAQSLAHKLTPLEMNILSGLPDWQLISRLTILLTIKGALINGLGQPFGFDLSRIEVNVPEDSIRVDGQPLLGWEFRLFRSALEGVIDEGVPFHELYQITVAFYRGNNLSKFIFIENPSDVHRWTQYFPLDNLIKVLGKLVE